MPSFPAPTLPDDAVEVWLTGQGCGSLHRTIAVDDLPESITAVPGWCFVAVKYEDDSMAFPTLEEFSEGELSVATGPVARRNGEMRLLDQERRAAEAEVAWVEAMNDPRNTPESRAILERWMVRYVELSDERLEGAWGLAGSD